MSNTENISNFSRRPQNERNNLSLLGAESSSSDAPAQISHRTSLVGNALGGPSRGDQKDIPIVSGGVSRVGTLLIGSKTPAKDASTPLRSGVSSRLASSLHGAGSDAVAGVPNTADHRDVRGVGGSGVGGGGGHEASDLSFRLRTISVVSTTDGGAPDDDRDNITTNNKTPARAGGGGGGGNREGGLRLASYADPHIRSQPSMLGSASLTSRAQHGDAVSAEEGGGGSRLVVTASNLSKKSSVAASSLATPSRLMDAYLGMDHSPVGNTAPHTTETKSNDTTTATNPSHADDEPTYKAHPTPSIHRRVSKVPLYSTEETSAPASAHAPAAAPAEDDWGDLRRDSDDMPLIDRGDDMPMSIENNTTTTYDDAEVTINHITPRDPRRASTRYRAEETVGPSRLNNEDEEDRSRAEDGGFGSYYSGGGGGGGGGGVRSSYGREPHALPNGSSTKHGVNQSHQIDHRHLQQGKYDSFVSGHAAGYRAASRSPSPSSPSAAQRAASVDAQQAHLRNEVERLSNMLMNKDVELGLLQREAALTGAAARRSKGNATGMVNKKSSAFAARAPSPSTDPLAHRRVGAGSHEEEGTAVRGGLTLHAFPKTVSQSPHPHSSHRSHSLPIAVPAAPPAPAVSAATLMEMQDLWRTIHYQQDDMSRATDELKHEYARLKAQHSLITAERDRLLQKVTALEKASRSTDNVHERQQQDLRDQIRQLSVRVAGQGEAVAAAKSAAEEAQSRQSEAEAALVSSRAEVNDLHHKLGEMANTIDNLSRNTKSELHAAEAKIASLFVVNGTFEDTITTLTRDKAALNEQLAAALLTHRQLESKVSEENESRRKLEDQMKSFGLTYTDEIMTLKRQLEEGDSLFKSREKALESALEEAMASSSKMEAERATALREAEAERERARALEEETLRKSNEALEAAAKERAQSAQTIKESQELCTKLSGDLAVADERISSLTSQINELSKKESERVNGPQHVVVAAVNGDPHRKGTEGQLEGVGSLDREGGEEAMGTQDSNTDDFVVQDPTKFVSVQHTADELRQRVAELEDDLSMQMQRGERLEEAMRSLTRDLSESEQRHTEEVNRLTAAFERAQSEGSQDRRGTIDALEKQKDANRKLLEQISDLQAVYETRMDVMRSQNTRDMDMLREQVDTLNREIESMIAVSQQREETMANTHKKELDTLANELRECEALNSTLRQALDAKEAQFIDAQSGLSAVCEANKETLLEIREFEENVAEEKTAHENEVQELRAHIAELEGILGALRRVVEPVTSPPSMSSPSPIVLQLSASESDPKSASQRAQDSTSSANNQTTVPSSPASPFNFNERKSMDDDLGPRSDHRNKAVASGAPLSAVVPAAVSTSFGAGSASAPTSVDRGSTNPLLLPSLIDDIVEELKEHRKEKEGYDKARDELTLTFEEVRREKEALEVKLSETDEELIKKTSQLSTLQARLKEVEGIATELNHECGDLQESLEREETAHTTVKAERDNLVASVRQLREQIDRFAIEEALRASKVPTTATRGSSPFIRPAMERGVSPYRVANSERGVSPIRAQPTSERGVSPMPTPQPQARSVATTTSHRPSPIRNERGVSPFRSNLVSSGTQSSTANDRMLHARGTSPIDFDVSAGRTTSFDGYSRNQRQGVAGGKSDAGAQTHDHDAKVSRSMGTSPMRSALPSVSGAVNNNNINNGGGGISSGSERSPSVGPIHARERHEDVNPRAQQEASGLDQEAIIAFLEEEREALRGDTESLREELGEVRVVAQQRIADLHDRLAEERGEKEELVRQLETLQQTYDAERKAHAELKIAVAAMARGGGPENNVSLEELESAREVARAEERAYWTARCQVLKEEIAMRDARIADLKSLLAELQLSGKEEWAPTSADKRAAKEEGYQRDHQRTEAAQGSDHPRGGGATAAKADTRGTPVREGTPPTSATTRPAAIVTSTVSTVTSTSTYESAAYQPRQLTPQTRTEDRPVSGAAAATNSPIPKAPQQRHNTNSVTSEPLTAHPKENVFHSGGRSEAFANDGITAHRGPSLVHTHTSVEPHPHHLQATATGSLPSTRIHAHGSTSDLTAHRGVPPPAESVVSARMEYRMPTPRLPPDTAYRGPAGVGGMEDTTPNPAQRGFVRSPQSAYNAGNGLPAQAYLHSGQPPRDVVSQPYDLEGGGYRVALTPPSRAGHAGAGTQSASRGRHRAWF